MASRTVGSEEIAIVAVAQTPSYRRFTETEPQLLLSLTNEILADTGLARHDIDFTIAGSCDYLSGLPFAFVSNVDDLAVDPPIIVVKDGRDAPNEVDSITGATISSKAVVKAINEALAGWAQYLPEGNAIPPAPEDAPTEPMDESEAEAPAGDGGAS